MQYQWWTTWCRKLFVQNLLELVAGKLILPTQVPHSSGETKERLCSIFHMPCLTVHNLSTAPHAISFSLLPHAPCLICLMLLFYNLTDSIFVKLSNGVYCILLWHSKEHILTNIRGQFPKYYQCKFFMTKKTNKKQKTKQTAVTCTSASTLSLGINLAACRYNSRTSSYSFLKIQNCISTTNEKLPAEEQACYRPWANLHLLHSDREASSASVGPLLQLHTL